VDSVQETFIKITTSLDYMMLIVTARGDMGPAGCLVGFSTQCSVQPPRYLVCLSDKNRTQRVASATDVLAVHFLNAEAKDLARLFGEQTTDEDNTFSRCRWHPGPSEVPILDDCGRWFAGRILERQPLGDHVGFLLEPIAAHNNETEDGLFFQQVKDLEPGHQP
jgi:flavin reductase (DIM6/NTAB) family NADH-FMN oxidoreductase RutF